MKRKIAAAFLVILFFVLQSTLFQALNFGGISPNLLIILTSSFGFMCGKKYGLVVGFFSGLLTDIFFGNVVGLYALIYMYIGYGNGLFHSIFYQNDIKLPMILIMISDALYGLICYVFLFLLQGKFHFGYYFSTIIFPEMIYTIGITIIIYPLVLWINTKCEETEKGSDQRFV